jgi:hypothetical protein
LKKNAATPNIFFQGHDTEMKLILVMIKTSHTQIIGHTGEPNTRQGTEDRNVKIYALSGDTVAMCTIHDACSSYKFRKIQDA